MRELDLVTSKAALLSMLEEVGGPDVLDAHKASTGKVIRSVIRQFVTGEGREKVEGWVPSAILFTPDSRLDPQVESPERQAA